MNPVVASEVARRCVYPGSFDPVTLGHVDVVRRLVRLFDEVVVAVLHNPDKVGTFAPEQRVAFVTEAVAGLPGVRVVCHGGRLLVDVCRDLGAGVVVKGVRGSGDVAQEWQMALMNRHLSGVETLLLPADPRYAHISSSLVRQVNAYGGDVHDLVPEAVRQALTGRR
ncbi:MAG: pantetheine-phosphate adenylyltransferase [Angustibacter sp.]